jgi:hypothetical protein
MELWTYRKQLSDDLPGTLATIRKLGFTDIETASFYERSALEFRRELDKAELTCSSYITSCERLGKEFDAVVSEANAFGRQVRSHSRHSAHRQVHLRGLPESCDGFQSVERKTESSMASVRLSRSRLRISAYP